MEILKEAPSKFYYIITLSPSKKNSLLLDEKCEMRKEMRRNHDYMIVPFRAWLTMKDLYDAEITVNNVFNLFISFSCNGLSFKSLYVHGVEKVFDVIAAMFVNKMFEVESFKKIFSVKFNGEEVEPLDSFEKIATETNRICIVVEKRKPLNSFKRKAVAESIKVDESNFIHPSVEAIAIPEKPVEEEKPAEEEVKCVGIPNLGNTCFMNSAIQCLNNCPVFANFFSEGEFQQGVSCEWAKLAKEMKELSFASARDLKIEIGKKNEIYQRFEEQDAFEFIAAFLDILHEEELSTTKSNAGNLLSEALNTGNSLSENLNEGNLNGKNLNEKNLNGKNLNGKNEVKEKNLLNRKNCYNSDWNNFISENKSIITENFYGMTATILKCKHCGFRKHKSDPFLSLSLSIPSEVIYHHSVTLVFENSKVPMKILASINFSVSELVSFARKEYNIEGDLLPIEYENSTPVSSLRDSQMIQDVKTKIVLYEYRRDCIYFLCKVNYRKLVFFSEKLPLDLLIKERDARGGIYKKLDPFLCRPFTLEELFTNIDMENYRMDPVFKIPVLSIYVKNHEKVFGDNFRLLKNINMESPIAPNIHDCIANFTKEETVELSCDECENSEFIFSTKLTKLPRYLIIHLKRFSFNKTEAKIRALVDFQTEIKVENQKYSLIGCCNHIEVGLGYGHYLAYIYRGNRWYCCNDSVVTKCLKPDKRSAYVLFYERAC